MDVLINSPGKTKKILFIYLKMSGADFEIASETEYRIKRLPQLGFQYLSSILKQKGISVELLDQTIEPFETEYLIKRIADERYDFIGLYSATALKQRVIETVKKIRSNRIETPIIIGGPGHFGSEEYLKNGATIVCHGEAEATIAEIVCGKMPLSAVKGISYIQDNLIYHNPLRPLIKNLDSIPFPDRSLYPIEKYYDFQIFGMRLPYTTMIASRGCKYRCIFCSSPNHWGNVYRVRPVENVFKEIEELIRDYNVRYIGFKDDLFGGEEKWLEEFLKGLIGRNYPVKWSCTIHPFVFKKDCERKAYLFKKAGCDFFSIGLQSSDSNILKLIGRSPEEPEILNKLVKEAKKNDITVMYEFILGLPGESVLSMQNDLDYALKNRPHYIQFYNLSKLEGSEIYRRYKDKNTCNFSDKQIREYCVKLMRGYYTRLPVVFNILLHILRKNPRWLLRGFRHLFYLLDATGIRRNKN